MINNSHYKELCKYCDKLIGYNPSISRLSISFLHIIRPHHIHSNNYELIFLKSNFSFFSHLLSKLIKTLSSFFMSFSRVLSQRNSYNIDYSNVDVIFVSHLFNINQVQSSKDLYFNDLYKDLKLNSVNPGRIYINHSKNKLSLKDDIIIGNNDSHVARGRLDIADGSTLQSFNGFILNSDANNGSSITPTNTNTNFSIYTDSNIACEHLYMISDRRVKTGIEPVNDKKALDILNNIECYEYNHKGDANPHKTIGYIAQEVKSVLPNSVNTIKSFIPSVMKTIDTKWRYTDDLLCLECDISDNIGSIYKFMVSNSGDLNHTEYISTIYKKNNHFIFDKKWDTIFCYGKEVDDFHTLDKSDIYALYHSAIQQLNSDNIKQNNKINELTKLVEKLTTYNVKLNEKIDDIVKLNMT